MRSRTGALLLALTLVAFPAAPAAADDVPAEPEVTEPTIEAPTPDPEPEASPEPTVEAPSEDEPAPDETPVGPLAPQVAAAEGEGADHTEIRQIDGAELRWGLTSESNNMSHAPGRFNFFSAGRLADPGHGGFTVRESDWRQKAGTVSIEKSNGTTYAPATWAGLKTTASGAAITSPSAGTYSDHQFVFSDGEGEIDPTTGDGSIQWDGDVTVIYYSGFTFFYLSDPELTVDDGAGTVRATLGGFESSQEDLGVWSPIPETEVVLAELGSVDLTGEAPGFTASPKYLGRSVTGVDQVKLDPATWGAFPQSFIDFHVRSGSAGFWYSSGSAFDRLKVPLPMTVSLDADDPLVPPTPPPSSGGVEVVNDIVNAPNLNAPNLTPPTGTTPLAAALQAATTAGGDVTAAADNVQQAGQPVTLSSVSATSTSNAPNAALWWWIAAAFLALAASTVAGTYVFTAASTRR